MVYPNCMQLPNVINARFVWDIFTELRYLARFPLWKNEWWRNCRLEFHGFRLLFSLYNDQVGEQMLLQTRLVYLFWYEIERRVLILLSWTILLLLKWDAFSGYCRWGGWCVAILWPVPHHPARILSIKWPAKKAFSHCCCLWGRETLFIRRKAVLIYSLNKKTSLQCYHLRRVIGMYVILSCHFIT